MKRGSAGNSFCTDIPRYIVHLIQAMPTLATLPMTAGHLRHVGRECGAQRRGWTLMSGVVSETAKLEAWPDAEVYLSSGSGSVKY